jgi:hypothetical protein
VSRDSLPTLPEGEVRDDAPAWPTADEIRNVPAPMGGETGDAYVRRCGVRHFSYAAWCVRSVPPLALWPHMIPILRLADIARDLAEQPLHIPSGFRSQAVNAAVGGAPSSTHVQNCAVDLDCISGGDDAHRRLYAAAAQVFSTYGRALGMGLGLYAPPVPPHFGTRIHLDAASSHAAPRWWGPGTSTGKWVPDLLASLGLPMP